MVPFIHPSGYTRLCEDFYIFYDILAYRQKVVTMIYRPLYGDKIMAYTDTPFVKILTGARRCGKSPILKMIMERLKTDRNIPAGRMISCRYDSNNDQTIRISSPSPA
jgi:hypothetical protein